MAYDMGTVMTAEPNYYLQSVLQGAVEHVFAGRAGEAGTLMRAYGYQWDTAA